MKLLLSIFILAFSGTAVQVNRFASTHFLKCPVNRSSFKLNFFRVPFPNNRDELQPAFSVKNNFFVYAFEDAWLPDKKRRQGGETICTGPFMCSSEDSVKQILSKLKTNKIYVSRHFLTGGCLDGLSISRGNARYSFEMFNTSDSTAQLIVNILNNYIPADKKKIHLMKKLKK